MSDFAAVITPAVSGGRPILIDENDGLCEICAAHRSFHCDRCGKVVDPRDVNMGKAGYQSVRPSHFHLVQINGIPGRRGIFEELCYGCHRADRFAVYGEALSDNTDGLDAV